MRGRRGGVAVPVVLGALVLGACTSTVTGTATPGETVAPATDPGTASPSAGPGPTPEPTGVTPAPERGPGTVLEAHRIAGVTALVPVTQPDRTEPCAPAGPYTGAADLETGYFAAGTAAPVLDRWGFVAAWGQCGAVPGGGPATLTMVAELSDPDSAQRAAEELAAAQQINGFEPFDVPGLDAPALLLVDGGQDLLQVFVPVGRMLAYAYHEAPQGTGAADVIALLDDQLPQVGAFEPTPQADVPALPADPRGLAGLAVDPPGQPGEVSGPYDLEGYLRLAIDPVRERELLTANGFRGFYTKQSTEGDLSYAVALYEFPGTAETNRVYDAFAELESAAYGGTRFTLPSVPQAPCFVFDAGDGTSVQRCYVGFRSHLASVDVGGLTAPDDVARMDRLLPAQRDRIAG